MIYVHRKPEPSSFNELVRTKGLAHLRARGLSINDPLPPRTEIIPYWKACLPDLHQQYDGICAYLGIFIERVAGTPSADHFIAKSRNAGLAYEWSNYRLACSRMNSRKRDFNDVLDPFSDVLIWGLFRLELVTGKIYPNPNFPNSHLNPSAMQPVEATIKRLGLDDPDCRQERANWFNEYLSESISSDFLKKKCPVVWIEADRQGLL
jgi:hypothetical protein